MPINAENKGGSSFLIPEGLYKARCYEMVELGTIDNGYGKQQHKVRLSFELPELKHVFDEDQGEQCVSIKKIYTLSLSEKATLRKHLENWRGHPFSSEELKGFDITQILGAPCKILVSNEIHTESGDKYAKIVSISKLASKEAIKQENPNYVFSFDLPETEFVEKFMNLHEHWQKIIQSSDQWASVNKYFAPDGEKAETKKTDDFGQVDDDMPF